MAITKVNTNQERFQDPKRVIFVPWTDISTLGTDGYDIHDIVGDTTNLSQEDAERNEIPWEFGDDPLDENTSLGTRTITMQCLDFQNTIMQQLFGCSIDATTGAVIFPSEYKDLYCLIQLEFEDKSIVMPKVKMDAKTVFENLRSDIARGELSGTLYSTEVVVSGTTSETPLMFVPAGKAYTITNVTITVGNGDTETTIEGGSSTTMSVTPTTLSFTSAADQVGKTATVSNAPDTISVASSETWATATVSENTVTVKVTANEGDAERTATVTVTSGTETAEITVTQAAA